MRNILMKILNLLRSALKKSWCWDDSKNLIYSYNFCRWKTEILNIISYCRIFWNRYLLISTPFYLQEHLAKHAGDKPYKCEVCPKQFNHKTDLRRHMCLHTGEKPFTCDVCGKGFIREDRMVKHADTHKKKAAHVAGGLMWQQADLFWPSHNI